MKQIPGDWQLVLHDVQNYYHDAVIAGGAVRDLLLDRDVKDIDIFVQDDGVRSTMDIRNELKSIYGRRAQIVINDAFVQYADNMDGVAWAVEVETGFTPPLQVIGLDYQVDVQSAVDRIDFGLCRVGFDGSNMYVSREFWQDAKNKTFTLMRFNNEQQLLRSLQRYLRLKEKYRGFELEMGPQGWRWAYDLVADGKIGEEILMPVSAKERGAALSPERVNAWKL